MNPRRYYSVRAGRNERAAQLDLPWLQELVFNLYATLDRKAYFEESFGKDCPDGFRAGTAGEDLGAYAFIALRRYGVFPLDAARKYTEDELFDLIEFLFDHVSLPEDGWFHGHAGCGNHFEVFDREAGQNEYRRQVNTFLSDYKMGWELTESGEILSLGGPGLTTLLTAVVPAIDPKNVSQRVDASVTKFRRHGSSIEDRKAAVRDLADVLEFMRDDVKKVLTRKDEADLFQLANQFGIRHHNADQKTDYDLDIWLSWMFYHYLATIHAATRLIERDNAKAQGHAG